MQTRVCPAWRCDSHPSLSAFTPRDPLGRNCFHAHFVAEEAEVQRGGVTDRAGSRRARSAGSRRRDSGSVFTVQPNPASPASREQLATSGRQLKSLPLGFCSSAHPRRTGGAFLSQSARAWTSDLDRQGVGRIGFPLGRPPQARKQPPSESLRGLSVRGCVYKDTSSVGLGSHFYDLISLNHRPEGPVSKHGHSEPRASTRKFSRAAVQSVTTSYAVAVTQL